jgi:hypothetical protein
MIRPCLATVCIALTVAVGGCFLIGNQPPTASFQCSADPRPRAEITFTNTSTDPDGFDDLREFVWDFGDNSDPADTLNATHIYATSGVYTIKLTVTDSQGGTDSCRQDLEVKSPIFADPVVASEAVGEGIIWDPVLQVNRIVGTYQYSEMMEAWVICYPMFLDPASGLPYLVPRDICGLIPIDFQPDLDQPIVLRLSWRLTDSDGATLYWYDYATDFPIRDPTRVTGLYAAWDLWNQGWDLHQHSADGVMLNTGLYTVVLTVLEVNTGDIFYWYFPLYVQGTC